MRRGFRNLVTRRSDQSAGRAATQATEAQDVEAADIPSDDTAWGLDVWVEGMDPVVDIVVIHGLNGHREKTWTAKNKVNWLRDPNMLPAFIPNARIMSWGYDANTHSTKELSAMYLYDHAYNLVSDLSRHRRLDNTDTRPIIFVAHSLGGIVLKCALIHSDSARSKHLYHHRSVKTSTYGIIFMGTPHQGGEGVAWGKRLVNIASIFVKTNDRLLKVLEKDCEALHQQVRQFAAISGDFETKFAFETRSTPLVAGSSILVVPKTSAVVSSQADAEAIAIMDNHTNMVRFSTPNNEYKRLAGHLKLMVEKAPKKVQENWLTERDVELSREKYLKPNFKVAFDLTGIPTTSHFIGRNSDLKLMAEQLMPGQVLDRRKICVIHGLGGMGKTQLAIEFGRLNKDVYTSFFWLDGKTEESLIQSLLVVGLRLPKGQIPDTALQDIKDSEESKKRAHEVLKWFTIEGNTQWLLIFDNIDKTTFEEEATDNNSESSSSYDITHYFPGGDRGSIIVTTRLKRLVSLGDSIHLRKVDVVDGLLILEKHVRRNLTKSISAEKSEIDQWDPDAVSLVERLGCLPLALVLAGSYISKTTIPKYLELYNKSWAELHETMRNRNDYPQRTIITTWQISFDEVKLKDEGAAKLLQLWGYLDNQDLWFHLLKWEDYEEYAPSWLRKITASEISFLATIDTLLDYSLIEQNDNSQTYSIHSVVHDWIRASLRETKDEDMLCTAISTVGLAVPDNYMRDSSSLQRRLLPHVIHCLQRWDPVDYLHPHLSLAYLVSLSHIGNLYRNQGRLAEAEAMLQQALSDKENVLGTEHTSTLDTVTILGDLYRQQDRLAEAEVMLQQALAGYEKALGTEHIFTLDIVNNLGILYWQQGRLAEAEAMYQQALAGYENVLGTEHTSILNTVHNLGVLYRQQGRLAEAEAMYQQALAGCEKALGAEHTSTLDTVNCLGDLYRQQDRLAEAEAMLQQALAGFEKALGAEHTSTINTVHNLGILYEQQGRLVAVGSSFDCSSLGI